MSEFIHLRHKPPVALERPRDLIVACAPMRSHVNLSHIVRMAGCCAVPTVICCGAAKIDERIARDGADTVDVIVRRSLRYPLEELKQQNYRLVGLEQATSSQSLHAYQFQRRSVLVVGNERLGLEEDILRLMDDVVEIPVWGLPYSYNVATATALALYEYCRQYPKG